MRGKIRRWFPTKGFGFMAPENGGPDVFVHVTMLDPADDARCLRVGDPVSFDPKLDSNGRAKALNVRLLPRVKGPG
jgi:CspA family cold shock protein